MLAPGKLAVVTALLLVSGFLKAQERPPWARSLPGLPVREGWYQGLGSVKATGNDDADWESAAGKARAQIASQIRVRIASTVTRAIQETSSGDGVSYAEVFATQTEQITTATLEGIVLDRWFDDRQSTLYAYGAIAQAEVERRLRENMENALASARVYHLAARRALERRDPYSACAQLLEAVKVIALAEAMLERTISASLDSSSPAIPVFPVLQSQFCGVVSRFSFEATGGDGQMAERSQALAEPLRGRLLFRSDAGTYPVRGARLAVRIVTPATGRVAPDTRTGAEGEFLVPVNEITSGEASNRIRITLALGGIEGLTARYPDVERCWSGAYHDFTFRLSERTTVSVAVRILERNLKDVRSPSAVQAAITKALTGARYTVVEEARVRTTLSADAVTQATGEGNYGAAAGILREFAQLGIVGEVSTAQRGNPYPQMYFASGRAVIAILDNQTGRVLGTVQLENEKEGGANYEAAGNRLLQRMAEKIAPLIRAELDKALQ